MSISDLRAVTVARAAFGVAALTVQAQSPGPPNPADVQAAYCDEAPKYWIGGCQRPAVFDQSRGGKAGAMRTTAHRHYRESRLVPRMHF